MKPAQQDIDNLRAVERAFGIDAPAPTTLGALDGRTQHVALLAEMLRNLRGLPEAPNRLLPETHLSDLGLGPAPTLDRLRTLGARADLDLLPLTPRSLGVLGMRIGAGILLGGLAVGLTVGTGEWGGLLLLLAMPTVLFLEPRTSSLGRLETVSDVLRESLPQNTSRLRVPQLPETDAERTAHLLDLCTFITTPGHLPPRGPSIPPSPTEAMPWQT